MKYRLTAPHYIEDRVLPAGTVIGEGTEFPFLLPDGTPRPPSTEMEGLDDESIAAVKAVIDKTLPMTFQPPVPEPAGADPTKDPLVVTTGGKGAK